MVKVFLNDFVIDIPENEKWKNLLIIIDTLGKGFILKFCNSIDAEIVAEIFIRRSSRQQGLFAIIISERSRQFVNIFWKKNYQIFGIERKPSTFYHPQIDKITERIN